VLPRVFPGAITQPRQTFLLYEALFLALALGLLTLALPRVRASGVAAPVHRYLQELTVFEAVQYGLWAAADVAILAGHDAGFGLRLVPNFMYYAGFLPFALLRAPREAREAS
jgi:hypothetical protein